MPYCIFPLTREMNYLTADELDKNLLEGGCNELSPDGRYHCDFPCSEGVHRAMTGDGHEIAEWVAKDMVDRPVLHFFDTAAQDWVKNANPGDHMFPKQKTGKSFKHDTLEEVMRFILKAHGKQPVRNRRKSRKKQRGDGAPTRHSLDEVIQSIAKRYGILLCSGCQKIEPCTECYPCSICTKKRNPTMRGEKCSNCAACPECCRCFTCSNCQHRKSATDRHWNEGEAGRRRGCGRCNSCCECRTSIPYMSGITAFNGEPSDRYPRFMGVEIECGIKTVRKGDKLTYEPLRDLAVEYGAGIGSDGSVHVEGLNSIELVTAPSRGSHFVKQVTEVCDLLGKYEAKVNKSCGLHVHVDMRRVSQIKILAAVRAYSRVERALFSIVSFSRRGEAKATLIKYKKQGGYAGPWADRFKLAGVLNDEATIESRIKAMDVMIYGSEAMATSYKTSHGKHQSRYHGLNVQALHVHNTLEFRLHQGTVNGYKILMWAGVCSAIVEYALAKGEDHIKAMKGSSAAILEQMLGGDQELITWCRARRAYFIEKERKRRGLAPWTLGQKAPAPGPVEESESSGPDRTRLAFRREQEQAARGVRRPPPPASTSFDSVAEWAPTVAVNPRRR